MAEKEYIERGAVIHLTDILDEFLNDYERLHFVKKVKQLPAADVVEVVHGEWILHMDGSGTCKRCGVTQKLVWDPDNWQNYCGHCGARMDGGKVR